MYIIFFYFSNGCNRSTQQANRLGHYLPSYAQCTTNTFLAPSHTHVNHLPASKGKIKPFHIVLYFILGRYFGMKICYDEK